MTNKDKTAKGDKMKRILVLMLVLSVQVFGQLTDLPKLLIKDLNSTKNPVIVYYNPSDSSFYNINDTKTVTATIDSGASLSDTLDLGTLFRLLTIQMPATWTTAGLTFKTSPDGITYTDLYNESTEYSLTVAASRNIKTNTSVLKGVRYLIVRSGTAASPVAQGGSRAIKLGLGIY